ncbi:MAG: hypothetical protein CTY38_01205 [Methylotenera sp.]|uniref:Fic family protein n=1 Tax=Methylotenera sp. TaxID=2051956 RepID=UPI000D4E1D09|nr:Fic family protein [Methylotenera sp.]PPC84694.1 MAG: hypothetical protein CTY38_01205 [Methylotenera sp.]
MLIFSTEKTRSTILSQERSGRLIKLATGIYSTDHETDPAIQIRQQIGRVLSYLRPGAVISHRSALLNDYGLSEGQIIVTDPSIKKPYVTVLPGLAIRAFPGEPALSTDAKTGEPIGTLHVSSVVRAMLENSEQSRISEFGSKVADETVFNKKLTPMVANKEARAFFLRALDEANTEANGAWDAQLDKLKARINAVDYDTKMKSAVASVDTYRISLFENLATELTRGIHNNANYWGDGLKDFPAAPSLKDHSFYNFAFFASYFSNYIEGTEFEVDEAKDLVDSINPNHYRIKEGHDIRSLYELYSNPKELLLPEKDQNDFIENMKRWHFHFMNHPSKDGLLPGQFKDRVNRAGNTVFTEPHLVDATLRRAYEIGRSIQNPLDQAIYRAMTTVSVHPFIDGNGRITRLSANSILARHGKQNFMIPIVFREDYILAMQSFSRGDVVPCIRMFSRAMAITNEVPWSKPWQEVTDWLRENSAFCTPSQSKWGSVPPPPPDNHKVTP